MARRAGGVIDLAIVGGGTAGIAAATEAKARGLTSIILEASDRVGGRAHSVAWQGHALDLGAGWLHSADRNPMVPLAEQQGLQINRAPSVWRKQYRNLGYSPEEQADSWTAMETFEERLLTSPPSSDRASDALDPGGEWNGFLNAISNYLNGADLSHVSAEDWVAYWEASDMDNWRLIQGYGGLVSALAHSFDVRTGCAVREIDWTSEHVRLTTARGTFEARQAVIAVPTSALSSGKIRFFPTLDDRLDAAAQLPLGHVEKLFFALDDPERFPSDTHLTGNPRSAESGSYTIRPIGMPVIEAFLAGTWLKQLRTDGLAAKGREELGSLLGADFARNLKVVAASGWRTHPFICGSYSFARPGQHGARARLRAPVDGPIAFAGEACSDEDFATVHGAWRSGLEAVAQLFGDR
jgi:monoamine oxidase